MKEILKVLVKITNLTNKREMINDYMIQEQKSKENKEKK